MGNSTQRVIMTITIKDLSSTGHPNEVDRMIMEALTTGKKKQKFIGQDHETHIHFIEDDMVRSRFIINLRYHTSVMLTLLNIYHFFSLYCYKLCKLIV